MKVKLWHVLGGLGGGTVALAIALPNAVEARKHGSEAASIGGLKTLSSSQSLFREGDKDGDATLDHGDLAELRDARLVDGVLGGGTRQGHEFVWHAVTGPVSPGTTGDRYFVTNHAGVVYYAGTQGQAITMRPGDVSVPADLLPLGGAPATAPTASDPRRFERVPENPWREVRGEDLRSTFSVDVDTASYTAVRQSLRHRTLPPPGAVRIEELVNAFDYAYASPSEGDARPFAVHAAAAACPWRRGHRLVRIGLKGREVHAAARPAANLVFLVDVSGSMQDARKLPLVKHGLRLLADQLGERDTVSMVVYAGASGLVLAPTPGDRRAAILEAIDRLEAGGSTNGGAGIQLAYQTAVQAMKADGINRVVLLTDGDFNVGVTARDELEALIGRRARSGVFLSVLGFGMDHQDATLERLADRGNGHYAYVDGPDEARRVLVEKLTGTLLTIAKDVKVQVAWDPARVRASRLIGYENRALANRDFADDTKDAGEVGAGHTVTALYEVALHEGAAPAGPLGSVELRWKAPAEDVSQRSTQTLPDAGASFEAAPADLRFAAAVAAFGMLLRGSEHAGEATFAWARRAADAAKGKDPRQAELVELVAVAEALTADEREATGGDE